MSVLPAVRDPGDAATDPSGGDAEAGDARGAERRGYGRQRDRQRAEAEELAPAEVATEQLVEVAVRLREVLAESLSRRAVHRRVVAFEHAWVRGELVRRRTE